MPRQCSQVLGDVTPGLALSGPQPRAFPINCTSVSSLAPWLFSQWNWGCQEKKWTQPVQLGSLTLHRVVFFSLSPCWMVPFPMAGTTRQSDGHKANHRARNTTLQCRLVTPRNSSSKHILITSLSPDNKEVWCFRGSKQQIIYPQVISFFTWGSTETPSSALLEQQAGSPNVSCPSWRGRR